MERVILLERSRVPLFLRHRRGNFTRPKARKQKIKMHRQGSSLCNGDTTEASHTAGRAAESTGTNHMAREPVKSCAAYKSTESFRNWQNPSAGTAQADH